MTNVKKIFLFLAILFSAIILAPNFSNAANTTSVANEAALNEAITNATDGDTILLNADITLSRPIEISKKTLTIDGANHTISRNTESWEAVGQNATLITSGIEANVTLSNLILRYSEKYGAQAYNGGYLALDNVTVADCSYGGIIVNAGTLEIRDLMLHRNGGTSNNGIEIAKGTSVNTGDNQPTIIMNGKLESTEQENVIYIAINDQLSEFAVENTDTTINKILGSGNKVVITDENNNIIFESNSTDKAQFSGDPFVPNVTITINIMEKNITIEVPQGTTLTKEQLQQKINLQNLGLTDYTVDGLYTDKDFKSEYDYTKPFTDNTLLFAKVSQSKTEDPEKDTSPKTGIEDHIQIAVLVLISSVLSTVALKRKEY